MGSVSLWGKKLDHAIRHKNGVSLDVGSATLMVDGCNPGCVGWPSSAVGHVPPKRFLAPLVCRVRCAVSRGVRCPVIMRLITSDNHKSSIVA